MRLFFSSVQCTKMLFHSGWRVCGIYHPQISKKCIFSLINGRKTISMMLNSRCQMKSMCHKTWSIYVSDSNLPPPPPPQKFQSRRVISPPVILFWGVLPSQQCRFTPAGAGVFSTLVRYLTPTKMVSDICLPPAK